MAICVDDPENPQYSSAFCEGIRNGDMSIFREAFVRLSQRPVPRFDICDAEGVDCPEAAKGPWQEIQKIAGEFNEPGKFTALIGFEYSPTLVDGGMLHRNVIFRGTAVTADAMGVWDRDTQADFWDWLDHACREPCRALAIPHNSNYSWGFMFADSNDDGAAYTRRGLAASRQIRAAGRDRAAQGQLRVRVRPRHHRRGVRLRAHLPVLQARSGHRVRARRRLRAQRAQARPPARERDRPQSLQARVHRLDRHPQLDPGRDRREHLPRPSRQQRRHDREAAPRRPAAGAAEPAA